MEYAGRLTRKVLTDTPAMKGVKTRLRNSLVKKFGMLPDAATAFIDNEALVVPNEYNPISRWRREGDDLVYKPARIKGEARTALGEWTQYSAAHQRVLQHEENLKAAKAVQNKSMRWLKSKKLWNSGVMPDEIRAQVGAILQGIAVPAQHVPDPNDPMNVGDGYGYGYGGYGGFAAF